MIVTLPGGERILIRPIEPSDQAGLALGMQRLSVEARYQRFFAPVMRLAERDLIYLTDVDHHDHEALVGIEERTHTLIAVARYVRTAAEVAEPAIVVGDAWQARGLGTALLSALAARALEEGIVRFVAEVLAANSGAIRVFERLGETSRSLDGTNLTLTIELRPDGTETGLPAGAATLSKRRMS